MADLIRIGRKPEARGPHRINEDTDEDEEDEEDDEDEDDDVGC
jgi:hypothetical protein